MLVASGVWLPAVGETNGSWQTSTGACIGWTSWLNNFMDPNADIIVDLGAGTDTPNSQTPIAAENLTIGGGKPFAPP